MRFKKPFFVCGTILFLSLAGCQIQASDNYYVVDIYSDYEGMEADMASLGHYVSSKAKKVGYCYAIKNKAANTDVIHAYKYSGDKIYEPKVSQRTAAHGYQYDFKAFAGNYEDGTAINTANISADCALFATFSLNKVEYLVSVEDAFGVTYKGFNYPVSYDTKVSAQEDLSGALLDFPAHDVEGGRDPYYLDFAPKGWNVYEYKGEDQMSTAEKAAGKDVVIDEHGLRDEDDKPMTAFLPYNDADAIKNYQITNKTTFRAAFEEGEKKSFKVTLSYQLRTLEGYSATGKPNYSYSDFAEAPAVASQDVVHGQALNELALGVPNYRIVGNGKNGELDYYPSTADVPEVLRGAPVVRKNIKYNCAITLLYERAETATLRFHGDLDNPATVPADTEQDQYTQVIALGDGTIAPPLIGGNTLLENYRFTNLWSTKPFDAGDLNYEPYDLSNIAATGEVDLYPILMKREITQGSFKFQFDLAYAGYLLNDIEAGTTSFDDTDVLDASFPTRYPYIGVYSFGHARSDLTSVKLGSRVTYIGHGELSLLVNGLTIDLEKTSITELPSYAFKNLVHTTSIRLPASLKTVGIGMFDHCLALTDIYIDMTAEEVAAKGFPEDWNCGIHVTYKS